MGLIQNKTYSFILSFSFPSLILTSSILPAIITRFRTPVLKSLLFDSEATEVIYPFAINLLVPWVNNAVMSLSW